MAMKAGASGYMAGRAIFNEYFEQPSSATRAKDLDAAVSSTWYLGKGEKTGSSAPVKGDY